MMSAAYPVHGGSPGSSPGQGVQHERPRVPAYIMVGGCDTLLRGVEQSVLPVTASVAGEGTATYPVVGSDRRERLLKFCEMLHSGQSTHAAPAIGENPSRWGAETCREQRACQHHVLLPSGERASHQTALVPTSG